MEKIISFESEFLEDGHLSIPEKIKKKLKLKKGYKLYLTTEKVEGKDKNFWFKELYKMFADLRIEASKETEEKINDNIKKAIKESRKRRDKSSI